MLKYCIFAISLLSCQFIQALEVSSVYSGFDNSNRYKEFNFITFMVHNNSPQAFDDVIQLRDRSISAKTINSKRVFLAPNQSKSIQMYYYLPNSYSDLQLAWRNQSVNLKLLGPSPVTNIYIGSRSRRLPAGVKVFLPEHFPPSVSYTPGLNMVILDGNPDWTPHQKQAFMDWLSLGGSLYILKQQSGQYPKFTSSMSELNKVDKKFALGRGEVMKVTTLNSINTQPKMALITDNDNDNDFATEIFNNLQLLVKTDHNWGLIYFLIIIYLALIGPLNYLIARKTRDWRLPNLFFLAVVFGFSLLFSFIGKRGYGESTKIHSFSFADHIQNDQYLIKQWSNIFVTSGDTYSLRHKTSGNLYASPNNFEMMTNIVQDEGSFIAEIPLFSSKQMIHSGKAQGALFQFSNVQKDNLELTPSTDIKVDHAWFLIDGTVYKANQKGNQKGNQFSAGSKMNLSTHLRYNNNAKRSYRIMRELLLQECSRQGTLLSPINDGDIYFFALTKTPPGFLSQGSISENESGQTLHRFKLKPAKALKE